MKLVRYGTVGRERPGVMDAAGRIRDLSKIIPDIGGETLSPKSLAKLRDSIPKNCPLSAVGDASGLASAKLAISSLSV